MKSDGKIESPFPPWLVGSWVSVSSSITGYVPGNEWLTWTTGGEETWKMTAGSNIENVAGRFRCQFHDGVLQRWHEKNGKEYQPLRISRLDDGVIEIAHPPVEPVHRTVFRRTVDG